VRDATLPAGRWNPSQYFPGTNVQHWKDLSPRIGIAYDLFGNGKTALKATATRYVDAEAYDKANTADPQVKIIRTDARTWTDLNGDYTIYNPDGSLQASELGPTSNANFGKIAPNTTTIDSNTLNGWNARVSTVEYTVSLQHQLTPRLAANAGYYFRYLGNQLVTDNTLVTNADYTGPFCVTSPTSADLPGGGGYAVCGLYDITPDARPRVQNNMAFARNFGGVTDHYSGVDLGFSARLPGGTFANIGLNMQGRLFDQCHAVTVDTPESRFCRTVTPYQPDFKVFLSREWAWGLVTSATYMLAPGPPITATWSAPNSLIAPQLGRNLSAGATATKAIELIEPGTQYGKNMNELDLRLSKALKVGRYRLRGDLNLYNVFNDDFATSINTTFSTSAASQFLRPTGVLQGRLFKIGGQIEF
jgi:hypothetical protein